MIALNEMAILVPVPMIEQFLERTRVPMDPVTPLSIKLVLLFPPPVMTVIETYPQLLPASPTLPPEKLMAPAILLEETTPFLETAIL